MSRITHLESINQQLNKEAVKLLLQLRATGLTQEQRGLLTELIENQQQKTDNIFEMMEFVASEKARVDRTLKSLPILCLKVPLSVPIPTKKQLGKKYRLNLNNLRSAPKWDYNKAKVAFSKIIKEQLDNYGEIIEITKPIGKIDITAKIYKKQNRECDPDNYCVVNKFVLDSLVACNYLKDHSYKFVNSATCSWGGIIGEDFAEISIYNA